MKRLLALLAVLITLCTCFTACGDEPTEYNGYQMISNTDVVEYYFYVPASWEIDNQTGMTSAHVSSSDLTNVSMATFELPQGITTLEAYCTYYQEEELPKIGAPVYSVQNKNRLLGKNNEAASQSEFTLKMGEKTYHYMQIICLHANRAYLFTYTAHDAEKYAEHMDEVEKSLGVFEFFQ